MGIISSIAAYSNSNHNKNYIRMVPRGVLLACVLVCVTALELEDLADVKYGQSRQPKLFFVSSSSTTSSVSTSTVCFLSTSSGILTCGKRRRRSLVVNGISGEAGQIQPMSASSFDEESDSNLKLESGAEDPTTSDRDGRFLLYWLTTTSTSTTTIYTGTSTLATLDCTPGGYTLSACG